MKALPPHTKQKMKMLTEAQIEKYVVEYAINLGCYVRKFSSPNHRGVPDRLFLSPSGVVFFIEFKAPGKVPTALQLKEMNLINNRQGNAHWVDSATDGKKIVDLYC